MIGPLFSVIVPAYNAASTLTATVRGVLNQSCSDFELILLNDGSTDDTLHVMLTLAASDQRIKVISHDNKGVAGSRNVGIDCSRGRLIAFLDADDQWYPTKLSEHYALHVRSPDLDISFARIAFVPEERAGGASARTESTVPAGRIGVLQLIGENPVCTASNLVVARACFERIGGFVAGMSYAEDQEWLVRAASQGATIEGIDRLLVDYHMSAQGLSSDLGRMHAGWRDLAYPYRHLIDLKSAEANYCRYLSRRALRTGARRADAFRYAAAGLRIEHRAFLSDTRRAVLTIAGAVAALILSAGMRQRLFA